MDISTLKAEGKVLAELTTVDTQYDRWALVVYYHEGKNYLYINDGYDPRIEVIDVVPDNWDDYLRGIVVGEWDHDCPEIEWLSRWGLLTDEKLGKYVAPEDYTGECYIWVSRCYYGCDPSSLLRDEAGEIVTFPTVEVAKKWIEKQNEGVYYLAHNEAGRPSYYIIKEV